MNNINNIFNKNEIENKLKIFQEGKDYSVSPTDEPNIKTYNFHNDKLRSMFRSDKVPVRVTREAYDGKDYKYRGHFEEGKDYSYSAQQWCYGENFQGNRGTDILPEDHFLKNWMNGVKWDEHSRIEVRGESGNFHTGQKYWEGSWVYQGKGTGNQEPKKIDGHSHTPIEGQWCCGMDEASNRQAHLESWKKSRSEMEQQLERAKRNNDLKNMDRVNSIIATLDRKIREHEDWLAKNGKLVEKGQVNNNPDLQKENHELRQQLAAVQKQLAEVLAELKKLKSTGKDSEKLNQQIIQNERLIEGSSAASETEVRDQINKSEALMKEFNTIVSSTKDNKGNGSLPYVIGGSVILVSAGIIGYLLVKKNKRK